MLTRALQLNIVLWLASSAFAAQIPANNNQNHLLIRAAGFKRVDTNVRYDGVETDSGDVCLHYDPLLFRGWKYSWSDAAREFARLETW
jgi:hypothetical protein